MSPMASGLATPLPVEEAFRLRTEPRPDGLHLRWYIAPGFHLYREPLVAKTLDGTRLAKVSGRGVVK